jgi:hypothetical protein
MSGPDDPGWPDSANPDWVVEALPGPFWGVSYRDGEDEVLVQDLGGLVRHLEQQPGYEGDLTGALDTLCASATFDLAPASLVADILSHTGTDGVLPLPRSAQGRAKWGDGTARGGYGVQVFARDNYRCRYCGYDMGSTYRGWLQLSVDHVVPAHMAKLGYAKDLIEDMANLVTCCRSCNDFGNRYVVADPFPGDGEQFFNLRDRVFVQRRGRIALAHLREQERYRTLVSLSDAPDRPGDPA